MELQLLLVLLIAFIVLGPERMMDLAVKLGEAVRKIRQTWEEIKFQAYMEEMNRKILEEEEKALEDKTEDETEDEDMEELPQDTSEEIKKDESEQARAPDDASDGTSEGAQNKAN